MKGEQGTEIFVCSKNAALILLRYLVEFGLLLPYLKKYIPLPHQAGKYNYYCSRSQKKNPFLTRVSSLIGVHNRLSGCY